MKALEVKSAAKDASTRSRAVVSQKQPSHPVGASVFPGIIPAIQRKPLCPCDGGCPRCKNSGMIQPKLTIGQPNDKYEQEADRIADQVMRMPEPVGSLVNSHWSLGKGEKESSLVNSQSSFKRGGAELVQTKPLAEQISPLVQRKCSSCDELDEEEPVQLKSSTGNLPPVTESLQNQIQSLRGGGQPLPETSRAFFEPRFGQDFSQIRVHTDAKAADAARSINSRAFTTGKDVFFNSGQYSPGTATGKRLMGHELTHVVQQGKNLISQHLQALTKEEKKKDLESEKYSGNQRLQKAYDNDPPLKIGESGDAVRLVQEGLVADGFAMPRSTKPTGEMDGGFGEETFAVVKKFQAKHLLSVDGIVGRETMGKLDELALKGQILPYCDDIEQDNGDSPSGSTNAQMAKHFVPNPTPGIGEGLCIPHYGHYVQECYDYPDMKRIWEGHHRAILAINKAQTELSNVNRNQNVKAIYNFYFKDLSKLEQVKGNLGKIKEGLCKHYMYHCHCECKTPDPQSKHKVDKECRFGVEAGTGGYSDDAAKEDIVFCMDNIINFATAGMAVLIIHENAHRMGFYLWDHYCHNSSDGKCRGVEPCKSMSADNALKCADSYACLVDNIWDL